MENIDENLGRLPAAAVSWSPPLGSRTASFAHRFDRRDKNKVGPPLPRESPKEPRAPALNFSTPLFLHLPPKSEHDEAQRETSQRLLYL
jgi:hypothetical protein